MSELQALSAKLDALHTIVIEVKDLATKTNGRVRKLEQWRAELRGAWRAIGIFPMLLSSLAAVSGIASLVVTVLNQ